MNIYVSPTGSDTTGDGSQSNPYQHLSYAVSQASSGDIIKLLDGTYYDNNYVHATVDNLTVESESEDYTKVIIYPTVLRQQAPADTYLFLDTNIIFKNITIIYDKGQLTNLENKEQDILYHYGDGKDIKFIKCFIKMINFDSFGYQCNIAGGFYQYGHPHVYFYKCSIIGVKNGHNSKIVSRGFNNNTSDDLDSYIQDSILYHCDYDIYNSDDIKEDNNNCIYDITNVVLNDSSDIFQDPKFVNYNTDAKLQGSSPCIDAGVIITGYIDSYKGGAPDIGVNEVGSGTISGQVTLNGTGVQGAIIRFLNTTTGKYEGSTTTDSNGDYIWSDADKNSKYHVFVEYTDSSTGEKFNALSKWDISPISNS